MRSRWMVLTVTSFLLFTGCSSLPTKEDWEKWKSDIHKVVGAAAGAVDKAQEMAEKAMEKAEAVQAAVDAKIEASFQELEAKGAPTGSSTELWDWVKSNPLEASGSLTAILTAFAALAAGYKRKDKKLATTQEALGTVARAVEDLPEDTKREVKNQVAQAGGDQPEIRATIRQAKA